jgi:hypothetical protein
MGEAHGSSKQIMKTRSSLLLTILFGVSFTAVTPVFGQGTAFTYQGLLTTSNGSVNGTYDLTFALWDSFAGGNQVGNSITNPGWHVSSGQLTVPIDFGPTFSGTPLWLEISVRTNGVGAFNTLTPRQALTPTPYAIYAESATGLANGVAIGSGAGNQILGTALNSFVGGGNANSIQDGSMNSVVAGGMGNVVQGGALNSFIGGGQNNQTFAAFSTINGGGGNVVIANGNYSTIGGGLQNTASGLYSTVAGGDGNTASGLEATVGGGTSNVASQRDATVSGGFTNKAIGQYATVGGGSNNIASGTESFIGGGALNSASQQYATVSGGFQNSAGGVNSTVGGGTLNIANGQYATVPGGYSSGAGGLASFAAGYKASAGNDNSFVWSDGETTFANVFGYYSSDRPQQFKIQAGGGIEMDVSGSSSVNPAAVYINSTSANGVGLFVVQPNSTDACLVLNSFAAGSGPCTGGGDLIKGFGWSLAQGPNPCFSGSPNQLVFEVTVTGDVHGHSFTSISDRNAKENFAAISPAQVLEKVNSLPITQWNFKGAESDVQHIGPMAQDFHDAFGLNGPDDKHISLTDEGGVALAAIQGLNQKLEDQLKSKDAEIQQLKARLESVERYINANATKGAAQ